LAQLGFQEAGYWECEGSTLSARISKLGDARDFLYAFVTDQDILYIGKSINTVRQRMAQYEQPGPTQKTNIRNNRDIMKLLTDDCEVRILVFVEPEPMFFRGYHVSLAAGLEDELIRRFHPRWNKLGKRRSPRLTGKTDPPENTSDNSSAAANESVWATIQSRLKPGTKIRNWSKFSGYLKGSFTVSAVGPDSIEVDSPGARNIQTVERQEFEKVLAIWDHYLAGDVPRHKIRDMTRFSTYIISVIHQVLG